MEQPKGTFLDQLGFVLKVGIDGFFGNAHFLSQIVHGNALKSEVQEQIGSRMENFIFHRANVQWKL